MTDLQQLFREACDIVENELKPEEIFMVRDLVRGFEWNRIPRGDRTRLGSMFFAYAQGDDGSKLIEPTDKTPQNQQRYRRR